MTRPTFVLPGIGRVTQAKNETRARAEKRARIQHGRKSSGKSFMVPGIGRVSKRKGETAKQAEERARKEHVKLSAVRIVEVFRGFNEVIDIIEEILPSLDVPNAVGKIRITWQRLDPSGLPGKDKPITIVLTAEGENVRDLIQEQLRKLYRKGEGPAIVSLITATVSRDDFHE